MKRPYVAYETAGNRKASRPAIAAKESGMDIWRTHFRQSDEFMVYGRKGSRWRQAVDGKVYEFESLIYEAGETGGAYVIFPYDIRKEFGRGRVKVHATFDGEGYDGSLVNMGVKNADGSVCYIIGVGKHIRFRIGKKPGDRVLVTVRERE